MLSIGAMANGQDEYYLNLGREDYYLEGGEPPGQWLGSGAGRLGLQGRVAGDELRALVQGISPDGERSLIRNAGSDGHQPGWDLTFSAPKSVSVLWSQTDQHTRGAIQEAHAAAVREALGYLEETAAFTRRGRGGTTKEPAGLVIATFEHGTSRAIDPQLHTHCLVLNVATRADGSTGTLLSKPFYEHKMVAGALYRAELSSQLERRLGVVCERTNSWFEIAGVPKPLMEWFSKRRAAIEDELLASGLETASAAAYAALATREPKDLVAPRSELFGQWREGGREHGFTQDRARAICGVAPKRNRTRELAGAFREATDKITSSQSHFTEKDFIRHTAEAAQGRGLDVSLIKGWARYDLEHSAKFVRLGVVDGQKHYTTVEMLQLEKDLLKTALGLKNDTSHKVRASTVKDVIGRRPKLAAEQRVAIEYATRRAGRVQVVSGMAGTGKTYMLGACREAWEKDGFKVIGAALSGKAARELEKGAGIRSDTLAKRLWDLDRGDSLGERIRHDAKQLVQAATGKPTHGFEPFKIDKHTILVLDEAGMVATRQMGKLIRAVADGGGKLILVGDARQLQPIEAGGPFAALGRQQGQTELTKIIRQDRKWARESVHDMAKGESAAALRRFAEHGLLSVAKNRDEAIKTLVSDWKKEGLRNPKENMIFVGTNLEATKINRLCQAARLERDEASTKTKVRVGSHTIYAGDRILCTKKSRMYGVENGDTGTAVRIDHTRQTITIKLDRQGTVTLPTREYTNLRLGYAVTTHKGQGATVNRAYVLVGGSMQDRETSYVQVSRACRETRLYTDELEAGEDLRRLAHQMRQSRAKSLSHDVLVTKPRLQPEIGR